MGQGASDEVQRGVGSLICVKEGTQRNVDPAYRHEEQPEDYYRVIAFLLASASPLFWLYPNEVFTTVKRLHLTSILLRPEVSTEAAVQAIIVLAILLYTFSIVYLIQQPRAADIACIVFMATALGCRIFVGDALTMMKGVVPFALSLAMGAKLGWDIHTTR